MTKARLPVSIEAAVLHALRILGVSTAAKAARISPTTLRDYSDPDRSGRLTVERAISLDAACYAKTGRGLLFEADARQLVRATGSMTVGQGDADDASVFYGAVNELFGALRKRNRANDENDTIVPMDAGTR